MQGELEFASVGLKSLYREYMPSVYRIAYSYMRNHHDSEDVVQETFLRLAQSGKRFEDERQVLAWLIITASNLCRDALRRSSRRDLSLDEVEPAASAREERSGLQEAVMALPNKYKTVIYLHYYEGYSTRELAKLLHRPESTIKTWLSRGRECLRESLGERGEYAR